MADKGKGSGGGKSGDTGGGKSGGGKSWPAHRSEKFQEKIDKGKNE